MLHAKIETSLTIIESSVSKLTDNNKVLWASLASIKLRWGFIQAVDMSLRGLFSGKAEKMSAELAHAEQVMLEHEKLHFSDKQINKQREKETGGAQEKYHSLYSSFDDLKPHEDLPPGLHKVLAIRCRCRQHCVLKRFVIV